MIFVDLCFHNIRIVFTIKLAIGRLVGVCAKFEMCRNEKSDKCRFKCFHNGIILIVICFQNVKPKLNKILKQTITHHEKSIRS